MKKLLALLAVLALVLSASVMGIGTVASAAEESPLADFMIFDGVLEEYIGAGGEVVIPASAGITEIAASAFYANKDVTSVVIPEGVEIIGNRAFENCENIEKITLPYSLTEIGGNAFASIMGLSEITLPGQLEIIPTWAFANCQGLKKIVFSYGIREIHHQAFCSLFGLGKVVFPETIEIIASGAFNCQKDTQAVEYIICNPDCEIGLFNDTYKGNIDHEWDPERYRTPFQSSYGVVTYKITVPENSAIQKFLEEKGEDMFNFDETDHKDKFRINAKEKSYFETLKENQKDYGITSAPEVNNTPGGTENQNPDEDPLDGNNPGTGNQNNNNNNNNNNGGNNNNNSNNANGGSTDSGLVSTIIIAAVVLVVVIIICVMVIVILFATGKLGGKKKEKEKPLTEAEMREKILKEMEAEKAAEEAASEATEE